MTVRDIFIAYGPSYLKEFGPRIPRHHRKVIQAITHCRTPSLGTILCRCESCGQTKDFPASFDSRLDRWVDFGYCIPGRKLSGRTV
ncbi:transposase zinc-binding domain-containing protein [Marispirochaeta sp.]|uniref:transposase zinc-binding domain-containing protein n=1 Tax=Marispirochaeta sp. TaxID=2038653 RepID=UPI0029C7BD72|nr:transposase zinc-binding domain-containing protein [Marispirochaeta sp.]